MKRLLLLLMLAVFCVPVGAQNTAQPAPVIASRFRQYTYATLPTAPRTGTRVTVTDCLTTACTAGGGSIRADLRWTGGAWEIIAAVGGAADLSATTSGDILKNNSGSIGGLTPTAASNGEFPCTESGAWVADCIAGRPYRTSSAAAPPIVNTDRGGWVVLTHATGAATIAAAGSAGFEVDYFTKVCNGGTGTVSITPATSTINVGGQTLAALSLARGACVELESDGTNYTGDVSEAKVWSCQVAVGDPGAASSALADDNDTPGVCKNDTPNAIIITGFSCYAPSGSPTVTPVMTAGGAIASGALTCDTTEGGAAGSLSGTPSLAANKTINVNITTAGGVAKYLVVYIKGMKL